MKPLVLKSKEDAIEALKRVERGANYFIFDNMSFYDFFESRIKILNLSVGGEKFRFSRFDDMETLNYHGFSFEDRIFIVSSSTENSQIPTLKDDSYIIEDLVVKAKNEELNLKVDIDECLFKYAKKLCFLHNVRFRSKREEVILNGENKGLAVSKQIDIAYRKGLESISFDLEKVPLSTLRCYASNLALMTGEKIRCSSAFKVGTIYFKEESTKDIAAEKIKKILIDLDFDNDRIALLDELKSFYE